MPGGPGQLPSSSSAAARVENAAGNDGGHAQAREIRDPINNDDDGDDNEPPSGKVQSSCYRRCSTRWWRLREHGSGPVRGSTANHPYRFAQPAGSRVVCPALRREARRRLGQVFLSVHRATCSRMYVFLVRGRPSRRKCAYFLRMAPSGWPSRGLAGDKRMYFSSAESFQKADVCISRARKTSSV